MAIVSAFVASCSTAGDPTFDFSNPSLAATEDGGMSSGVTTTSSETGTTSRPGPATESADELMMSSGSTAPLPQTVAYVPLVKPAAAFTAMQGETAATAMQGETAALDNPLAGAAGNQVSTPQAAPAAASDAQAQGAAAATAAAVPLPADKPAGPTPQLDNPVYVTATDPATAAPPPAPRSAAFCFAVRLDASFGGAVDRT